MHHIHHTHGFVLSSRNSGEANKMLTIYTRELGLVKAMAQGVRLSKSKLRFALQDFSYAYIDFVQGRDIWRVTSATNISSFPLVRAEKESVVFMARTASLVERLCAGEEAHSELFDMLIQAFEILDNENTTKESRTALELHTVLSIVHVLGYVGESEELSEYLGGEFSHEKTQKLLTDKKSIIAHINNALRESGL